MRILVVEDEPTTAQALKKGLESQSYAVDVEHDGEQGFRRARSKEYDLIILDNMLPGKEGPEICKDIRQYKIATPIMMLSVQTDVDRKAFLLNCGADDYLTKPYSFTELSARVDALLRRSGAKEPSGEAEVIEGLSIDRNTFTVTRDGVSAYLTPKEFELLEYFIKNRGRVLARGMILDHVWEGGGSLFSNAIETHIMNLRKKIDAGHGRKLIHTVPGRGYRFGADR